MDINLFYGMALVFTVMIVGLYFNIKRDIKASESERVEPLNKLNTSITELNTTMKHMIENDQVRDNRINNHGREIDDNTKKIINLDNRTTALEKHSDRLELRVGKLEERK